VLRTRHGASQPVTPSAAYASEAEPPLLHITTLTTDHHSAAACGWCDAECHCGQINRFDSCGRHSVPAIDG